MQRTAAKLRSDKNALTTKQKIKQQTARETATMMSTMMSVESSSSATARRWRARRAMQTETSQRQNETSNNQVTIKRNSCARKWESNGANGADGGRRGRRGERGDGANGAVQRVSDRVKEATY